jgi:hypothetical protein
MARRASVLVAFALLVLVVAGCGARNSKPFTAKGSAACFTKKGFTQVTTNPVKVGFIAGFANNGGLRTTASDGNVLTVAFTADESSVASTEQAYRSHAPPKLRPRMNDIMEAARNAVLVWTVSPTAKQLADAVSCLHP